jgi:hypothetical protein
MFNPKETVMQLEMPIETLRETLRNETSRWLGKAIRLVRNPHQCYQAEVRELWHIAQQNSVEKNNQDD